MNDLETRRQKHLDTVPPSDRSEAAARFDHAAEVVDLESHREPTPEELLAVAARRFHSRVTERLLEGGTYRDGAERYCTGRILSAGLSREICKITADVTADGDTDEDIHADWLRVRRDRRNYIKLRYGI